MESDKKIFQVCYSAPCKTIFSGEHSVVYDENAIVVAVDLRTNCKLIVEKLDSSLTNTSIKFEGQAASSIIVKNS